MRALRTRKLLITTGAALAAASLAGAGLAPPADLGSPVPDETALHEQLWAPPAAEAQRSGPSGAPERVPGGSHRELDAALERLVEAGAIGVTARVEAGDRTWTGAAGTRGLETRAPALERSAFRAASNTKMMIAALVLQEVEAGTWTLETPIAEVVPGIFPEHPEVTLRQLLSHTAGTPNGTAELLLSEMQDPSSIDELVELLGDRYPDAQHVAAANAGAWTAPGAFSYSNAGYVALGVALEVATDRSVGELLEERIFRPLRMTQTEYPDTPGLRGAAMREAMWDGATWHELDHFDPTFFSHAGAVVSTTRDLSRFTEALITGEIVDPALVDEMVQPRSHGPMEYGLGIYRVPDPCEPGAWLYGHDGGSMGTTSIAYTSADGARQLAFAVTGRDMSGAQPPLYDLSALLQPMLVASCG